MKNGDTWYGTSDDSNFVIHVSVVCDVTVTFDAETETVGMRCDNVVQKTWMEIDGIYVAGGNVVISYAVTLEGDVHIILMDGCSLTVDGGISGNNGAALTIYAQSTGDEMGKLTATGGQTEGLSVGIYVNNGGITINGGAVTATGGKEIDVSVGIYAYSGIAINGGHIIAETKATSETHSALNAALALPANYWWRTAEAETLTSSNFLRHTVYLQ